MAFLLFKFGRQAPAFIQAKRSKAGEPEFKDSEELWDGLDLSGGSLCRNATIKILSCFCKM